MKRYVTAYNYSVTNYDKNDTPLCILLKELSAFNKKKLYNLTLDPHQVEESYFSRLLELLKQTIPEQEITNKELIKMLNQLKKGHKHLGSKVMPELMIIAFLAFMTSAVAVVFKIFKVATAQKAPTTNTENTTNNLPSQEELLSIIDDDKIEDNLPIDEYQHYVWQLDGICNNNQNHPFNGEKEAVIFALIDELLAEDTKERLKFNGITNSNDLIDKIEAFMNRPSDNGKSLPLSQLDVNELLKKLLLELEEIDNNFDSDYCDTVNRLTNFIIFMNNNKGQLTSGQMLILGKKVEALINRLKQNSMISQEVVIVLYSQLNITDKEDKYKKNNNYSDSYVIILNA